MQKNSDKSSKFRFFFCQNICTCMQFVNMMQTAISLEKILRSSGLVNMQSFRQLSRKLVWWQRTSSMFDACREPEFRNFRKDHIWLETCASPVSLTHRLQVVLHNMPVGLHHLKHHVVLDVLHKVQHALSEGKRSGKPAHSSLSRVKIYVASFSGSH